MSNFKQCSNWGGVGDSLKKRLATHKRNTLIRKQAPKNRGNSNAKKNTHKHAYTYIAGTERSYNMTVVLFTCPRPLRAMR